jgi:flagellar motor protein MotB
MTRTGLIALLALIAAAGNFIGCENQCEQELQNLQLEHSELQERYGEAQQDLRAANMREADLLARAQSAENELSVCRVNLREAQRELSTAQQQLAQLRGQPAQQIESPRVGERITLSTDVVFASGRAELSEAGRGEVGQIAQRIQQRYPQGKVLVYGHTDNDPIRRTRNLWQDNLELSANRAMAVTRALIERGVSADRIETVAMGEADPAVANTSAENKARNRRVEVFILRD